MDDYYDNTCYCVVCGEPIPEGRMICPTCEEYYLKLEEQKQKEAEKEKCCCKKI